MFKTVRDIARIPDLRRRILYTLMMLALVRLGSLIPSPLMDAAVVKSYFASAGGVMALFDIMSGSAFSQMNLFAMGIQPYINASIIVNLLTVAIPKLEELQKDGESGRKKIQQYTRMVTLVLALVQAFGISYGLRSGFTSDLGVAWSIIVSMAVFTAGSMFVMWIGENITEKGIGNGISLIIMVNVLSRVPAAIGSLVGYESFWLVLAIAVALILAVAFIVLLELAERRIPIQYALTWPEREANPFPKLDFTKLAGLEFFDPDYDKFPALALAFQAGRIGKSAPAVLNGANEIAVAAFLREQIGFMEIPALVEWVLSQHTPVEIESFAHLLEIDQWARQQAEVFAKNRGK